MCGGVHVCAHAYGDSRLILGINLVYSFTLLIELGGLSNLGLPDVADKAKFICLVSL